MSFPGPPPRMSSPVPPQNWSSPSLPTIVSLPSPPSIARTTEAGSPADAPKMSSPPSSASSILDTAKVQRERAACQEETLVVVGRQVPRLVEAGAGDADGVEAIAAVEHVVAVARLNDPGPGVPDDQVDAGLAEGRVGAAAGVDIVVAGAAVEDFVARTAVERVVAVPAVDRRDLGVGEDAAVSSIVTESFPPPALTSIIVKVERWNWSTIERPFQTSIRSVSTDMRSRMASVAPSPFTTSRPPETVAVTAAPAGAAVPRHAMVSRNGRFSGTRNGSGAGRHAPVDVHGRPMLPADGSGRPVASGSG